MSKKKILFLSTAFPYPPICGHYLRTYNTLRYLSKNYDIYLLAFTKQNVDEVSLSHMRKICKNIEVFNISNKENKFHFIFSLLCNLFSSLPYVAQKYYNKKMDKRISEILCTEKIDLIHVYDRLTSLGALKAGNKIQKPVIVHFFDYWFPI